MNDTASVPFPAGTYNPFLHRLSIFLTIWTFFVVVIGGTVKSNEAGLSIPEPFIFHWMKDWWNTPNLRWEYCHRMIVGILYAGVWVLMIGTFIYERRAAVRRFSIYLLTIVTIQAIVGYLTVRLFAHPQTSIPHAALGQSFLAMITGMSVVLSPDWLSSAPASVEKESPSFQKLALWNLIAVFVQLLLGAALRHDDHGKAMLEGREWVFYTHLVAHVMGAAAVSYFLARLLFRVFRDHRGLPKILKPAKMIMMLLGVQILLGITAAIIKIVLFMSESAGIYADAPPLSRVWVATAHVAVGALIMAFSSVVLVRSHRYLAPAPLFANIESKSGNSDAKSGLREVSA